MADLSGSGRMLQVSDFTWQTRDDHCAWTGITCNNKKKVKTLNLDDLSLSGSYPSTLNKLGALRTLSTTGNAMTGSVSANGICSANNLSISADETNCPNAVDQTGCCDTIRMTSPSPYIDGIVENVLGSSDCDSLSGSESQVCSYMRNKDHHYIFNDDQYPVGFPYENWLKVRNSGLIGKR